MTSFVVAGRVAGAGSRMPRGSRRAALVGPFGLALFLSLFVMGPVISDINKDAIQPYLNGKVSVSQAYDAGVVPLKGFMLHNTRDEELTLMVNLSGEKKPANKSDVSLTTLIPA